MNKLQNFPYKKAWHILWLVIIFLITFVIGGASREALNWHMVLYALGWFGAALLVQFKYDILIKTTPRLPIILFIGLFFWCFITLLPLPAHWFSEKYLYTNLISERKILGFDGGVVTISLFPLGTLKSLFSFGPALFAMLCVPLLSERQRNNTLSGIVFLGVVSVLLGIGQVFTGRDSPLYFWDFTNRGFAVGVFANTNHQTAFSALLIPILYALGLLHRHKFNNGDEGLGYAALFLALCLLVVVGIVIGGSTAGYGLAIFALILSVLFLRVKEKYSLRKKAIFSVIGLGAIFSLVTVVYNSPRLYGLGTFSYGGGEESRKSINAKGLKIVEENFMSGTGYGSFTEVYPFYENAQLVTKRFVNHAHNDWLEWSIELGLPGIILLLIFGVWLGLKYLKLFFAKTRNTKQRMSRAAAISAMVLVLHSIVDYPLRTPLLSLLFWVLIAISITEPYEEKMRSKDSNLKRVRL